MGNTSFWTLKPDLGRLYAGYASVVCGLLLVNVAIGSQGASSGVEVLSGLVAALLQPVPMFMLARAKNRGHRWFRWAAIVWPVGLVVCVVAVRGGYPRGGSDMAKLLYYLGTAQVLNLPGAAVFGAVVGISELRHAKVRLRSHA